MDFKILTICIFVLTFNAQAQQIFTPKIIELNSSSPTYTVPSDSILKIESIAFASSSATTSWGLSTAWKPTIKISGSYILLWFHDQTGVIKYPFWLPAGETISWDVYCGFPDYRVFGLLMPK